MKKKIKNLPVFWRSFVVCAVVILTMLLALLVCANFMQRSLEQEKLSEILLRLEKDREQTVDTLYKTSAIPGAVEETKYFRMIVSQTDGVCQPKYISVLLYLKNSLTRQLYLRGDNLECLIYFPGLNSLCSTDHIFPAAADWLELRFGHQEDRHPELLAQLRTRGTVRMQALDHVDKNGVLYDCVALTICPRENRSSMLLLYTQEQLLQMLGMDMLPKGSVMVLTDTDGQVILQSPEGGPDAHTRYHEVTNRLEGLSVSVTTYIPVGALSEVVREFRIVVFIMLLICLLIGTLVSVFLSRENAKPLQKLAAHYAAGKDRRNNEIDLIADVLEQHVRQSEQMKDSVLQALAARAFSGAVIPMQDIQFLEQALPIRTACRAVVVYDSSDIAAAAAFFRKLPENVLLCSVISRNKCGLIMEDIPDPEKSIQAMLDEIQRSKTGVGEAASRPRCGVSDVFSAMQDLEQAIYEANASIPHQTQVGFYTGSENERDQLQGNLDCLYRDLAYRGTPAPMERLEALLSCVNAANGQKAFYNTQYVIQRVIYEQNYPIETEPLEYDVHLTAYDNMLRLKNTVRQFCIVPESEYETAEQNRGIGFLQYAEENFADAGISADTAAEFYGCTVKRVNAACRAALGMNFNDALSNIRMNHAAQMLVESDEGIQEIANQCGCPVGSTFFRLFKKQWGITPAQYRRSKTTKQAD